MRFFLVILSCLLYTGCVSGKEDRGYCLDYRTIPIEEERCTPLYGAVVCVVEQRTRTYCTLWSEDAHKEDA